MTPRRRALVLMPALATVVAATLALTGPAAAQTGAGQDSTAAAALQAARDIEGAMQMLARAEEAPDRVAALTSTTRAFEAELAAMRDGLRRVTARQAELSAELEAREGEIAQLLGTLQVMGGTQTPVVFLHPSGAVGTARSAMIVADVSRGLDQSASALRDDLAEVEVLRQLQQSAAATLADGLRGVQEARTDLSQAVADRRDLPRIHDPSHPMADAEGFYEGSTVDLMVELADAREAQRSYEANLKMLDQARMMTSGLLELLRR